MRERELPEAAKAEIAALEAALRERFGSAHPLLAPDTPRTALWVQAARWAFIYEEPHDE